MLSFQSDGSGWHLEAREIRSAAKIAFTNPVFSSILGLLFVHTHHVPNLPVTAFGINQPYTLSALVAPTLHNLRHDDHVVSHLHALFSQKPASHPPRSAHALLQATVHLDQTMPNALSIRISPRDSALHEGIGDPGIFEAAGGEFAGGFDGEVSTRGEFDVEGDVRFGGQRDGIERGDEKARGLGQLVRVLSLNLWCRSVTLVSQCGRRIVLGLLGWPAGYDDGERIRRGAHQVSYMSREVAPSCMAWFPVIIIGLFGGRIVFLFVRILLFQVPRGAEASAVRGRRWWPAKKTESGGGEAMARGHGGSA